MSTRRLDSSFGTVVGSVFSLVSMVAGCSGLGPNVSDGRYSEPNGRFSLPVPELGPGAKCEEKHETDPGTKLATGSVSFTDDFGQVRAVQYQQGPPEVAKTMSDPSVAPGMLKVFLHQAVVSRIQQFIPKTRVVQEDPTTLADGTPGYFAALEIPEGSPILQLSSEHPGGRRLDSTRGYLIVYRGDTFFALSAADDFNSMPAPNQADSKASGELEPAKWEKLKDMLTKLYSGTQFK